MVSCSRVKEAPNYILRIYSSSSTLADVPYNSYCSDWSGSQEDAQARALQHRWRKSRFGTGCCKTATLGFVPTMPVILCMAVLGKASRLFSLQSH
eukprot:4736795-Amphidinium_carterae.1